MWDYGRFQWLKYTGRTKENYLYIATNAHLLLVHINIYNGNTWTESYKDLPYLQLHIDATGDKVHPKIKMAYYWFISLLAHPPGHTVQRVNMRQLAYWDCGYESRSRCWCFSLLSVVYCQVEFSASGWSTVQKSPTVCGVSDRLRLRNIITGRHRDTRAVEPRKQM